MFPAMPLRIMDAIYGIIEIHFAVLWHGQQLDLDTCNSFRCLHHGNTPLVEKFISLTPIHFAERNGAI